MMVQSKAPLIDPRDFAKSIIHHKPIKLLIEAYINKPIELLIKALIDKA